MVGRTGARAEEPNVSTSSRTQGVHSQTGREAAAIRCTVSRKPGTGGPNGEHEAPTIHERDPHRGGWYGEGETADGLSPVAESF